MLINRSDLIYVTGHGGMVGSAIVRKLRQQGHDRILTASRQELDLRDGDRVLRFMQQHKPDVVVHTAARVGGIQANLDAPAEFLRDNMLMNLGVIHAACMTGVRRLCFLGSSCVYPRDCPQPMAEGSLLKGPFEPTNEGYALAKISGIRYAAYCRTQFGLDAFSVLPCNLYGTNDTFNPQTSHVLAAQIRRFHDAVRSRARQVTIWGTGSARREFMHVDDAATAIVLLLRTYSEAECINVGTGRDVSIRELVTLVASTTGYTGQIEWDASKPDGMPRKCLDVARLARHGFVPEISLEDGVRRTYAEYLQIQGGGPT